MVSIQRSLEAKLLIRLKQSAPENGESTFPIVALGNQAYAEFSRKLGLPQSTLHRLERCEQSITLRRLQQILTRLRCALRDVFGKEFR